MSVLQVEDRRLYRLAFFRKSRKRLVVERLLVLVRNAAASSCVAASLAVNHSMAAGLWAQPT